MALPGQTPKDPALTQREFDTWRETDAQWKHIMLAHVEGQEKLNLVNEGRLTALETNQSRLGTIAGWISAIVAAIVGGITGAFWSK